MASSDRQLAIYRVTAYDEVTVVDELDGERVVVSKTRDGKFWACKPVDRYQLFGECLGYSCAELFDIDAPDFASYEDSEDYWLSRLIGDVSHCDVARSDEITNFDSVGRLLVLDVFIGNFDRHLRNLLLDYEDRVRAWAIDFEKALAAKPGMFDVNALEDPSGIYQQLPSEMFLPHAREFVEEVPDIVRPQLRHILNECEQYARLGIPIEHIEQDLLERAEQLPELLDEYARALERGEP